MTRVTIVSDTHLSARVPETLAAWQAVHDHVARTRPDLVLHLGDLTLEGSEGPDDLVLARRLLDELPVPWRAVAGNHDEGDATWVEGAVEGVVDAAALRLWSEHVGPPWWAADLDGWSLLAVDAQLIGSGLEDEEEQWAWLEDRLSAAGDRPVVLASHKPVATPPGEGSEGPGIRFLPPEGRARLSTLLDRATVPLVVSGHVHQGRGLDLGGRHHLWAPTAWAVLPEHVQPTLGDKRCAVVELDLHPDGTCSATEVVPPGLAQLTVSEDLPNPYA